MNVTILLPCILQSLNFILLLLHYFLECVGDTGLAGTGASQGTCAAGEFCTALGECLGRSYYYYNNYFLNILCGTLL